MGPIKQFSKGQKEFMMDLLAPVNFVLLAFAYVVGVGISRFFIGKGKEFENESFWENSKLTEKEKKSFLQQF